MKILGEKETFKNSCVIYRRKMTLAFAFPSPWETVQYSFEPGAKKKRCNSCNGFYTRHCWMAPNEAAPNLLLLLCGCHRHRREWNASRTLSFQHHKRGKLRGKGKELAVLLVATWLCVINCVSALRREHGRRKRVQQNSAEGIIQGQWRLRECEAFLRVCVLSKPSGLDSAELLEVSTPSLTWYTWYSHADGPILFFP